MASTAQQQVAGILGETFANTKILVMFTLFALANLVGFSIKDFNLKICYWLSLTLIMVSLVNFNIISPPWLIPKRPTLSSSTS